MPDTRNSAEWAARGDGRTVFKSLRGAAKMMRHGEALEAPLAPSEDVVLDAPMAAAASAVEAALAGDHRPAADLLRHTRESRA